MLSYKLVNRILIVGLLLIISLVCFQVLAIIWFLPLFLLLLFLNVFFSFNIRYNFFVKAKHCNPDQKDRSIALTFDDGPNSAFTPQVLDLLKQYNQKATFFCIGKHLEEHAAIAKRILDEGHIIGSHSYSHSNNIGFFSSKKLLNEFKMFDNLFEKLFQMKPKFFRPPFGVTNPNISKAVINNNYLTFGWSVRSYDTVAKDVDKVYTRIIKKVKKGDVVLLHDTSSLSVSVLRKLLVYMDANDYKSITLAEMFNIEAYETN